jgi:hypothetical protein
MVTIHHLVARLEVLRRRPEVVGFRHAVETGVGMEIRGVNLGECTDPMDACGWAGPDWTGAGFSERLESEGITPPSRNFGFCLGCGRMGFIVVAIQN